MNVKLSETALSRTAVGTAITVVTGLIVAAVSLLVFVFDLLVMPEIDELIVSFVVCGIGLTTGFFILRRLVRRREPISLFSGPVDASIQPTSQAETRPQAEQLSPNCSEVAIAVPQVKRADPIGNGNQHKSISRYKARESSGALVFATAVGVSLVLGGRLAGGWEFLSLAVPAGGLVALVLYQVRNRQDASISGYMVPVAGGVVGSAALIGLGMVMVRFTFLREFLGLAIAGGGAVALVLYRGRRRRENTRISLV
jgi:hypothetical protein